MRLAFALVLSFALVACGRQPAENPATAPASPASPASPVSPVSPAKPRVVFLGDSLTAGLGLSTDQSFPSLISKKLKDKGLNYEVVNAGVSGDTSAGGLRRLDWSLEGDVRVLIVALGGNDGLRGLPVSDLKNNLATIIKTAKSKNITVILAGMEAPPNFGDDYTKAFRAVYADLAKEYQVKLIPFLLFGVAGDPSLNQADGIHPNIRGAQLVADLVWKALEPELGK